MDKLPLRSLIRSSHYAIGQFILFKRHMTWRSRGVGRGDAEVSDFSNWTLFKSIQKHTRLTETDSDWSHLLFVSMLIISRFAIC